ncbi:DHA2 family efflux MFS transporter permease subunit [Streptomyces xinghaiensis]|uniref:MDR family MFS transporter n=1 Tax=Streptomyces xinghaiensis TaxID=1038928 RepID=UPI003F4D61A7
MAEDAAPPPKGAGRDGGPGAPRALRASGAPGGTAAPGTPAAVRTADPDSTAPAPAGAPRPGEDLPRRTVRLAIGALLFGMLLAALDQTIVATALPVIVSELGGLDHLSWVVTAYLLAATAATPLWGKLGDQYGRKRLFLLAIGIFLMGSALCGIARDMPQLIVFRALQGLGGGGLMVLSMAITGDIVPPRERGRYQGLFGAVFGAASVLGPLLGGLFTEQLSWRWVFYVNLPIGLVALFVIAAVLHIPARPVRHTIDYSGILLIAAVAAVLVLLSSLGGTVWPWVSWRVAGLALLGAVLLAAFTAVERRAVEPVLPLGLFRIRTFTLGSVIGFVVGFAMFGTMIYLPTFLQVVRGLSPTASGVRMLWMVAGLLIASTVSGQLASRTGHWKVFPVAGCAVTTLGLLLLHRIDRFSPGWEINVSFTVFGLGLGLVLQIVVLAVQNAVGYEDLGAATSGATFFRSIGASFGVAVFGTVFSGRLGDRLTALLADERLPAGAGPADLASDPRTIDLLPARLRPEVLDAYSASITDVFLFAAPVTFGALVLAVLLKEEPLRGSVTTPDMSETYASNPVERSSHDEVARALSALGAREGCHGLYEDITARAGYSLDPAASWLLLRVRREGGADPAVLAGRGTLPLSVLTSAVRQIEGRGLAVRDGLPLRLTARGRKVAGRLAAAREEHLAALLGDWWGPDRPRDLEEVVRELSAELCGSDEEWPYDDGGPRHGGHRRGGHRHGHGHGGRHGVRHRADAGAGAGTGPGPHPG